MLMVAEQFNSFFVSTYSTFPTWEKAQTVLSLNRRRPLRRSIGTVGGTGLRHRVANERTIDRLVRRRPQPYLRARKQPIDKLFPQYYQY
jgi:hypothetical protein